jgi:hypothetical protein
MTWWRRRRGVTVWVGGEGLPELARGQPEPAVGRALVAHVQASGYGLGTHVVEIGQGEHLTNPRSGRRREERAGCLGGKPLPLASA